MRLKNNTSPKFLDVEWRKVQSYFDSHAATWHDNIPSESFLKIERVFASLNFADCRTILDVGCGSGILLPFFEKFISNYELVIELDISYQMLRETQKRSKSPKNKFVLGNGCFLPFTGNCFDWVICYNTFPHLILYQTALQEFARVTTQKGYILIFHSKSRAEINAFHRNLEKPIQKHSLPPEKKMRRLAHQAGLQIVRFEDTTNHYLVLASHQF